MNKISQTRTGREVKRSAAKAPPRRPAPVPASTQPPDFAALRATLAPLAEDDAWAAGLLALLDARTANLSGPEALSFPAPLRVPFDNRFEQCFEQLLSLVHRQNVQIAELWQIITELL